MYLKFESFSAEVNEVSAPFGLLFTLYEGRYLTRSLHELCAKTSRVLDTGRHIMSKHDMCGAG